MSNNESRSSSHVFLLVSYRASLSTYQASWSRAESITITDITSGADVIEGVTVAYSSDDTVCVVDFEERYGVHECLTSASSPINPFRTVYCRVSLLFYESEHEYSWSNFRPRTGVIPSIPRILDDRSAHDVPSLIVVFTIVGVDDGKRRGPIP
jgi:hypothetical protein